MQTHYLLVNILDASGSMHHLTQATIKGYNQYLKSQEGKGVNLVYTVTFNTTKTLIREFDTLSSGQITEADYQADGGTALYDAIGSTVEKIDHLIQVLSPNWKVIVNIITDGKENASNNFNANDIQKIVDDHTERGWLFMYAGAHKDAFSEGKRMNIRQENIIQVHHDENGIKNSFEAFEQGTRFYKK